MICGKVQTCYMVSWSSQKIMNEYIIFAVKINIEPNLVLVIVEQCVRSIFYIDDFTLLGVAPRG